MPGLSSISPARGDGWGWEERAKSCCRGVVGERESERERRGAGRGDWGSERYRAGTRNCRGRSGEGDEAGGVFGAALSWPCRFAVPASVRSRFALQLRHWKLVAEARAGGGHRATPNPCSNGFICRTITSFVVAAFVTKANGSIPSVSKKNDFTICTTRIAKVEEQDYP